MQHIKLLYTTQRASKTDDRFVVVNGNGTIAVQLIRVYYRGDHHVYYGPQNIDAFLLLTILSRVGLRGEQCFRDYPTRTFAILPCVSNHWQIYALLWDV